MTTRDEAPLSARGILFDGTAEDAKKALHRSMERKQLFEAVREALGVVRTEAVDAVRAEIVRQADDMISAPVVDAIVAAWQTYDRLVTAGQATLADASKTELVDLSSTEITSKNTWSVEVSVGTPCISLDFTLTVVFDLHAAVATVRGGKITSVGDARCDLHATFSAMGKVLADRQKRVNLDDHMSFDPGLVLVRPAPIETPIEPLTGASAESRSPSVGIFSASRGRDR